MVELTIAMLAHNVQDFIQASIQSVLSQKGLPFELLIISSGSTDGTVGVVNSVTDPRLRLIETTSRMDAGSLHNLALRESNAPYIAFVHAGDLLMPDALRTMIDPLNLDPIVAHTFCPSFMIDEHGKVKRDDYNCTVANVYGSGKNPDDIRQSIILDGLGTASLPTYRRASLDHLGPFNENVGTAY